MGFLKDHPVVTAIAVIVGGWLLNALFRLVRHRRGFKDLPGPPHHPIFGHLIAIGKVTQKLPKHQHPHVHPWFLSEEYKLPPVFYMDVWPLSRPFLVILDPETAQVVANSGLPKDPNVLHFIEPLASRSNILVDEGAQWKKWRTVFNPMFSVRQLTSQVPLMVDCTETLITIFDTHAEKDHVFKLEDESTKITVDIIGKVVCDHDFNSLTTRNEFVETMRKTLSWMPDYQSLNPLHHNNPIRPFAFRHYKKKMDQYIGRILDEQLAKRGAATKEKKNVGIDLALAEYAKEQKTNINLSPKAAMDAEFRRHAINNLITVMFAGHDTTSSVLCFAYHFLSRYPEKLARLRQELDEVFGKGVSAGEKIRQDPYIINQCEYTLAVIKETLRLWPPVSTVREGRKGYFVEDPETGDMLPTEGMTVWISNMAMHRDSRLWTDPVHEFIPERFLADNAAKLTPNAFRPFEKGPRNCIGQELALIELRVILAMTVREFDIRSALDEVDKLDNDGGVWQVHSTKDGVQEIWGDPMYQVLVAAGKPRDGCPARVRRRAM